MKNSYRRKAIRRSGRIYLIIAMAILLIGTMPLLFMACERRQIPEQSAATLQKDMQQLVELAEQKSETAARQPVAENMQSLGEKYHIPETYEISFTTLDDWLKVSIDADISIPDADKLPIAEIKSADFSQEMVSLLFERLCGKYEMYRQPDIVWTKAVIQENMKNMKRLLADPDIDPLNKQDIQKRLDAFEKLVDKAPETADTSVLQQTKGELYLRPGKRPDTPVEGHFSEPKDKSISFGVQNNESTPDFSGNVAIGATLTFMAERGRHNFSLYPLVRIKDETHVPVEAAGKMKITPAQVRNSIEALLKDTGMVIADISLYDDHNRQLVDGETSPGDNTRYAYRLLCRRAVEGVSDSVNSGTAGESLPGKPSKLWLYENFDIWYDDQGIFSLEWASPYAITEITNKDAKLLSFEEIQSVFRSMSNTIFNGETQYFTGAELEISYITLTLQRIGDMSVMGKGMLVPAWNFYGTYTQRGGPTGDYVSQRQPGSLEGSWMTINAIDGSIIDIRAGK